MVTFGTNIKNLIESYNLEKLEELKSDKVWQDPDTKLIWQKDISKKNILIKVL